MNDPASAYKHDFSLIHYASLYYLAQYCTKTDKSELFSLIIHREFPVSFLAPDQILGYLHIISLVKHALDIFLKDFTLILSLKFSLIIKFYIRIFLIPFFMHGFTRSNGHFFLINNQLLL